MAGTARALKVEGCCPSNARHLPDLEEYINFLGTKPARPQTNGIVAFNDDYR
jgi:hypothetical protein